jgi:ribokinase
MVGRVGDDAFGQSLLASLGQNGVDTTRVAVDGSASSGIALITVDDRAENTIVLVPGANGSVGQEDLLRLESVLGQTDLLLLQLEVPLDTVLAAAKLAEKMDVPVVLDPAPAQQLPAELYPLVDILTPNMTEAAMLVEFPVVDEDSVISAAGTLLGRGVRRVIVKMGRLGAYAADQESGQLHPAIPIEAVDTTAAGDAFNGGLAVALAEGRSFLEAMDWALAAGACAAAKEGAQPSMPGRDVLFELLAQSVGAARTQISSG